MNRDVGVPEAAGPAAAERGIRMVAPPFETTRTVAAFGHAQHLPWLFRWTDNAAVSRQSEAVRATRTRLCLLVAGAGFATLPDVWRIDAVHVLDLLSALSYLGYLTTAAWFRRREAKVHWQRHRTVAEYLRSMCWRYAVCGAPFGTDVADVDALFVVEVEEQLHRMKAVGWPDPRGEGRPGRAAEELITASMREIRAKPFPVRREIYVRDRVLEQRDWYRGRTDASHHASVVWSYAASVLTLFALGAGLGRALGVWTALDTAGFFSSAAAACVAWTELRQYRPLQEAHSLVAQQLTALAVTLGRTPDGPGWARDVATAEDAVSPERTAWLARHRR
jgi:SMODS and SLOG-associating 2TM effector domain 3/SMODS and SLOG-associating 2TM effector domain 1